MHLMICPSKVDVIVPFYIGRVGACKVICSLAGGVEHLDDLVPILL